MLTQGDTSQNQTHPYRVRHYQKAMIVFRESISPARFSGPLKILQCLLKRCIQRSLESLSASTNLQTLSSFVMPGEKNSEGQLVSRLTFGVGHFTCCVFWSEKKKKTHKRNNKYTHIVFGTWHPFLFVHPLNVFWFNTVASICITVWNAHICIEMWGGGNTSFIPCYICKFALLQNNEEFLISVVVSF